MLLRPNTLSSPRMDETGIQNRRVNILAEGLGGPKHTALDHSLGQGRPLQLGTAGERPPDRGSVFPSGASSPDLP
jgi:hypothetical protein